MDYPRSISSEGRAATAQSLQATGSMRLTASKRSLIDLFAGCGGLSLGMEQAGFTPVHVNELNGDALETYLANRVHFIADKPFSDNDNDLLHSKDIGELVGNDVLQRLLSYLSDAREVAVDHEDQGTSIDLVVGGPPCQGFSQLGHRRSYAVDRKEVAANRLYEKMSEVITQIRPRIFLFENVTGIRNAKWTLNSNEVIWNDVFRAFSEISGYKVKSSVVRAKDYGVPQNRPRVLLVGIRVDVLDHLRGKSFTDANTNEEIVANPKGTFRCEDQETDAIACGFLPRPASGKTYPDVQELLSDLVDDKVNEVLNTCDYPPGAFMTDTYPLGPLSGIQTELRTLRNGDVLAAGARLTDHEYSKHSPQVIRRFQYMIDNEGKIPEHMKTRKFAQRWLPPRWGRSGPAITVTSLPDDYVHFAQPRILSVREWARLQLFPDWYEFRGRRTTGGLRRAGNPLEGLYDRELPKYTQIGNAVPVRLAKIVGRHFSNMLDIAFG